MFFLADENVLKGRGTMMIQKRSKNCCHYCMSRQEMLGSRAQVKDLALERSMNSLTVGSAGKNKVYGYKCQ